MKKIYIIIIQFLLVSFAYTQVPLTNWTKEGPILFPVNASGQINGIGRTCQIKFHPTDTSIMYAVTSSGGAYVSYNNGNSWRVYRGTELMPRQSLASICIDVNNNANVYVGTGDANYYSGGSGVWKSIDNGNTFVQKNTGMGSRRVLELLQFNATPHHFIAATNNGIYKSVDTANNWVLKTASGLQFTDMEFKPGTGGRVIYASTFDSVYRSTDFGETWTTLRDNGYYVPTGAGGGQGVRIAVCPSDSNILYVGMVKNYGTLFKSVNGGNTFTVMKDSTMPNLTGYNNTLGDAGQGNYNFDINCDPVNPGIVFLVSHNVWKSTNSGVNWTQLTNWWAVVHTDMHHVAFSPHNTNRHYNANDGGIWMTLNGGTTWSIKSDSLDANEVSPFASSRLDKNFMSTGTQDNGELFRDASGWKTNRGGDWYNNMWYDWKRSNTVYYAKGARRVVSASEQTLGYPFTGDASVMEFNSKSIECAVVARRDSLFITRNLSSTPPTWTLIDTFVDNIVAIAWSTTDTQKLFVVTRNNKLYYSNNLFAGTPSFTLRILPGSTASAASATTIANKDSVLYVSCGNRIYRSQNYGTTFTNVSFNYPTINVIKLYHDPYTTDESVFAAGNLAVFYHKDTMTSWQNIIQNLPSIASLTRMDAFNDGSNQSQLRVSYYGKGIWSYPIQTNKIPSTRYSATPTTFCTASTVQFYDSTGNNPISWLWSFPGGVPSSSTLQNPVVHYPNPGNYNVTLTATNTNGSNTVTYTAYVNYLSDTIPIIHTFESSILPLNWQNIDVASDGEAWNYQNGISGFGVGTKCYRFDNYNLDARPNKDYLQSTYYDFSKFDSVWMSFDRAHAPYSGANRDSLEILIASNCSSSFNRIWMKGYTDLATAPAFTPSIFIPTSAQWKRDTISLSAYAGLSGVRLHFKNLPGWGQAIYLDNINFWGLKIPPIANAGRDTAICPSNSVQIGMTPQSGIRYQWFPSTGLSNDTISNPVCNISSTTTYVLRATSIRNQLNTYDTVVITINPKPTAFAGNDTSVCIGTTIPLGQAPQAGRSYTWTPSTALSSTSIANPLSNTTSSITYYLHVINTTTQCFSNDTIQITINPLPIAIAGNDTSICIGSSIQIGANTIAGNAYTWTPSTSLSSASISNPLSTPTSSITYVLQVINTATQCNKRDTITLDVNPLPIAFAGNDTSVCVGSTIQLGQTPITGNTYIWTPTTHLSSSIISNPFCNTVATTNYRVHVTNMLTQCFAEDTVSILVKNSTTSSLSASICSGSAYTFNGVALTGSGIYRDTLINSVGCDSIIVLTLTVTSCGTTTMVGNDNMCRPLNITSRYATTTPYASASYANINTHSDTIYQTNITSGRQSAEPIGSCGFADTNNKTMWYSLKAPFCATPSLHISTDDRDSTNFNTRVSVYRRNVLTSCTGGYTEIACNDDAAYYLNSGATNRSSSVLVPNSATSLTTPLLNEYAPGEDLYVQVSGVGALTGKYGLIIDAEPYVPTASNVRATMATLNWSPIYTNSSTWGPAAGAYVQWRPVGAAPTVAGTWRYVAAPIDTLQIKGLMPNTAYEFWASYPCGNGGRWWSKKSTFTTPATCTGTSPTISSVAVAPTSSYCNSLTTTFMATDPVYTYRVIRKRVSSSTFAVSPLYNALPTAQTWLSARLAFGETYEFWVVAFCAGSRSDSSGITPFTVCSSARTSAPTEDKDVVYILPNGDHVYGMPVNLIDLPIDMTNPGEQEITLQTIDATTYFGTTTETTGDVVVAKGDVSIYPNPASTEATISYTLADKAEVMNIRVVDAQGKEMMNRNVQQPAESGDFSINLNNYSGGIYFVKIQAGEFTTTKKLVIDKN